MKVGSSNLIEPGDCGVFDLIIDATGSDVSLVYNMELNISGMPKNLILYADEQMQHKIPVIDNSSNSVTDRKIKIEDFIGINDNSQTQIKRIYWQWPFESGTSDVEIASNDIDDSRYMGSSVEMQISVIAKQTDEEPIYLAKKVNVGDLVNYSAENENVTPYITDSSLTGSTDTVTFDPNNDEMAWKVLYVNQDFGIIELISADGTSNMLRLDGDVAFINAEKVLNDISSKYGNGDGAISGRSMKIQDIEQYSNYDKTTYTGSGINYGNTKLYRSGHFFKEIKDKAGNVIGYETTLSQASVDEPIEMTMTHYSTYMTSANFSSEQIYSMLLKKSNGGAKCYWLASRSTATNLYCNFNIGYVTTVGQLTGFWLKESQGIPHNSATYVCPVVILDTTLKTNNAKNANGGWDLVFDNAQ